MQYLYIFLTFFSSAIIFGLLSYFLAKRHFKNYLKSELAKNLPRRGFFEFTFQVTNKDPKKPSDPSKVEYVFEEIDYTNNKSKIKIIECKCENLMFNDEFMYKQYRAKFENAWMSENDIEWFDKNEKMITKQKLTQLLQEV